MSIELNCKDGYNIEIEKKEDRINILLVENEAFGERILVGAEERKEFLTPWINMLMHHKKEAGIKGTMDLAKKLEHIVLFEKGKHEKGVLALKSINTEIINLRKIEEFDMSFTGTICVSLTNGAVTYVSRRYIAKIKQLLGL